MSIAEAITAAHEAFELRLKDEQSCVAMFMFYHDQSTGEVRVKTAIRSGQDEHADAEMQDHVVTVLEAWCAKKREEWDNPI